jgi:hypothetical protein
VRSNAWRAYLSVDGDAIIRNREGRDVTSEFVDEFGGQRIGETPPLAKRAPDGHETDGCADLDHAALVAEQSPPLEPEQEGDEPYESGLISVGSPGTGPS